MASKKAEPAIVEVCGHELRVSNPGKLFFPERKLTKLDLVNYYLECEQAVVRRLRDRPTVMKRWVDGVQGEPFFQKRVPDSAPEWLQTATVTFPSGRHARELVPNDAAHLVWGVNLGVIDWNPWPVRRADLDHPDELRVDLDPCPDVPFAEVREVALGVREVLEEHGLLGFPKTSGSRGIHVYVRLEPDHDFLQVRTAALALAREVERRMPGRATSRWWKEEREGVFIDYNQNARDRTVASAYSVRAVPDARVSCPLEWDEVADVEPAELRMDTVPARLRERGDPSAEIDEHPGRLDSLLELAARDEREGLGDAPWPPHFAKQKGEPPRVQPSRARSAKRRPKPLALPRPPLKPQLALSRKELPAGEDYVYEVKLDGFRCLAFVDGEEVFLQSRNGKPLGRYFPELTLPPGRYVLDGEIVVRDADGTRGLRRARPAHPPGRLAHRAPGRGDPRRVRRLRPARPRRESLLERPSPSAARRSRSCSRASEFAAAPLELMQSTTDPKAAGRWLGTPRARSRRSARRPTARASARGWPRSSACARSTRSSSAGGPARRRDTVGALILGLYDEARGGAARRRALLGLHRRREAAPGRLPSRAYETGERGTAGPQSLERRQGPLEWVGLRPELVVEIDFDHVSAGRIRHGAKLRRWRDDKDPRECTFDQLSA